MRFANKTVLVFGGNSGIGAAAARAFADEGGRVAITGRDRATLDETLIGLPGGLAMVSDIADPAASRAAVERAVAALGGLDVVFVNAGVGGFAPLEETSEEFWDHIHAINLRGCVFAAQAATPHIRPGGSLIFTGSIGSVMPFPGNIAYGSAKAGLRAAARIIGAELVGRNIRVNMISPGPTETPIIKRNLGQKAGAEDALRAMMIAGTPMKRMGEPEEIAAAILFLASDEARFITGVDLFVDGGVVGL